MAMDAGKLEALVRTILAHGELIQPHYTLLVWPFPNQRAGKRSKGILEEKQRKTKRRRKALRPSDRKCRRPPALAQKITERSGEVLVESLNCARLNLAQLGYSNSTSSASSEALSKSHSLKSLRYSFSDPIISGRKLMSMIEG